MTGRRSRRSSTSSAASPPKAAGLRCARSAGRGLRQRRHAVVREADVIQLDFLVRRLAEKAAADPSLREQQPYKAAFEGDLHWFGDAITKHYQGDDSDLKVAWGR